MESSQLEKPIDEQDLPGSLLEHQKKVSEIFQNNHFKVVDLETPQPIVIFAQKTYFSPNKEQRFDSPATVGTAHFRYMNSLLLNGHAYVSTFKTFAATDYERKALATFRKYGFKTHSLPVDQMMLLLGGGVHCAAMQIPAVR